MDHSGGSSYIAERLDVFSNMKEGKDGVLFSEEFILNMNLVGQGPQLQTDLTFFWPIFLQKVGVHRKLRRKEIFDPQRVDRRTKSFEKTSRGWTMEWS